MATIHSLNIYNKKIMIIPRSQIRLQRGTSFDQCLPIDECMYCDKLITRLKDLAYIVEGSFSHASFLYVCHRCRGDDRDIADRVRHSIELMMGE
jgi:hypothetical protein